MFSLCSGNERLLCGFVRVSVPVVQHALLQCIVFLPKISHILLTQCSQFSFDILLFCLWACLWLCYVVEPAQVWDVWLKVHTDYYAYHVISYEGNETLTKVSVKVEILFC